MDTDAPINHPPFEATNTIELLSSDVGKITHISLYPSRADITRLFKFPVKVGQNQVIISGVPDVLDDNSISGRQGAAIVQDVTISFKPVPGVLDEFGLRVERNQSAMTRTVEAMSALSTYIATLSVVSVPPDELQAVIRRYDEAGVELDEKISRLKKESFQLRQEQVKDSLKFPSRPSKTVIVGIFGESEGEVDLIVHYGKKHSCKHGDGIFGESEGEVDLIVHYDVTGAGWTPVYDLRADTDARGKCIKLVYKASIAQPTGAAWEDVPLTIETSSPVFNVIFPTLSPWELSFANLGNTTQFLMPMIPQALTNDMSASLTASNFGARKKGRRPNRKAGMERRVAAVHHNPNDAGAVATFEIEDLKTIPSDGAVHKVTIAELELDAELSWVTIPKKAGMHWKAMVHNTSDYPLLKGMASIFINGSFISRSEIPYVSPQEHFSFSLGIDPSIRVVYHPREKKRSQTGFYSKPDNHVFTQRISLANKKSCTVDNVKIIDHIPISEESSITVKLLSPTLPLDDSTLDKGVNMTKSVQVGKRVAAQWEKDDNDSDSDDPESLGSDGKLSWICSIPAHSKVNLVLSWEIAASADGVIEGL